MPLSTTMPSCIITPAVAPEVTDRANITTSADFLWWGTYLGGLEFAISGALDLDASPGSLNVERGKVKKPPFAWAPGMKLSIGVDYRLDNWNTTATYTGLYSSREHTSVHRDDKKELAINFPVQPLFNALVFSFGFGAWGAVEAECTWKQKFNVLDVDLARNFFISKTLTLRPHIGLKASWIEEEFAVSFPEIVPVIAPGGISAPSQLNAFYQLKQRQWGLGTRLGLNAVWHITKEFGLYGDLSATALWSSYRNHMDEVTLWVPPSFDTEPLSNITTLNTDGRIFEILPIYELGFGIEYMHWFHNDACLFFLKAGWEEQIWSEFNQFVLPYDRLHGDLSLHGIDVRMGFTF